MHKLHLCSLAACGEALKIYIHSLAYMQIFHFCTQHALKTFVHKLQTITNCDFNNTTDFGE